MWDVLEQIKNFPLEETIHGLQGYICGLLLAHGIIRDKTASVLGALLIAFCFIAYESLEQARIHDQGDSDVMVFWAITVISSLIYTFIHCCRRKIKSVLLSTKKSIGTRIKRN